MAIQVFVDTGYFIARLAERDQWHARAVRAWSEEMEPVTSNLIINETATLLQARRLFSTALSFVQTSAASREIRVVHVDPVVQAQAWDLFARYGGAGATVIDCSSFAIMRSLSIRRAFTFDQHFQAAGFEILP